MCTDIYKVRLINRKSAGGAWVKRNIRVTMVSLAVVLLVAIGLYFWVFDPEQREEDIVEYTETVTQSAQGQKISTASEEKSVDLAEDHAQTGEPKPEDHIETDELAPGDHSKLDKPTTEEQQRQNSDITGQSQLTEEATLIFAGDIYLSSYVQNNYDSNGIEGVVAETLLTEMQQADITIANQEFPISSGGTKVAGKQFNFRVDPTYTKMLTEMGIDVVGLANNHALDYGTEALTDTFTALETAGIDYVGAGADQARAMQPSIIEARQRRFGFLAASRVIPEVDWNVENRQPGILCTYDSALLCQAIEEAKKQCDFLTVYVHWGIEKSNTPEEYQRQLAYQYIDAGADLVIGAHPHVLQGIEYYNDKPIVYSLGNYIFNQEIISTVLLRVRVTLQNEVVLKIIPAYASGALTQEMDTDAAAELFLQIEDLSFDVMVDADGTVWPK